MPDRGRGRGGDPDDGRPRRAGDRRRRRVRLRARGRARRGPRRRPSACSARSRPTAVNLAWALDRMRRRPVRRARAAAPRRRGRALPADGGARRRAASRRARARSRTATPAGSRPAATAAPSARCSTAWERGLLAHVWVDETRPLLQGARLTAWELETAAIPHAVIADSAAASLMARGRGRLRRSPAPTGSPRTATRRTRSARTRSPCSRATTDPALRRRADARPSTSRRRPAPAIPIEERDPAEITARFAGAQPGLRRHAGRR